MRNIGSQTKESLRLALIIAVLVGLFTFLRPGEFPTLLNLQALGFSIPEIGLLTLAIVIAMTSGGIDLSIVGIANLAAIAIARLGAWGTDHLVHPTYLALGAVLLVIILGALCGLINGLLVAYLHIRPILVTLATGSLYTGLGIAITEGKSLYSLPGPIVNLGVATVAGIPIVILAFIVLAAGIGFIMKRTTFGLTALMYGENPEASKYCAFSVAKVHILTYTFIGAICGITALFTSARSASASAGFGASYIMLAITIAILGGTSPMGGRINILGAVLATFLLQILANGFNLLQISPYIYQIAQGLILAVFVVSAVNKTGGPAPSGRFSFFRKKALAS